ncbi:haloacid dehalogenase type II [Shouchella shacheensis]|uniref:haloacid dehalogenase type II n=1 Tax=Shouchella shacheensis TaxID=1649580 RepID=UPI00073FB1AE|nr:haloacid dehalogenase type II [Shouchella shacheensis]
MVQAYVFDVYGTLFDVHSVRTDVERFYPGKGKHLSTIWREKQIHYSFLRQIMGRYHSFYDVTRDALRFAANAVEVPLTPKLEQQLMEAYLHLPPFEESAPVLTALKNKGKQTIVFSNGSVNMLRPLLQNSGLDTFIDVTLSVDERKQYKPSPAAYNLILEHTDLKREQILFASSNGWDISGAESFGFQTAWINRNGQPQEELQLSPDHEYEDLSFLPEIP